jgi:hypothetical protein
MLQWSLCSRLISSDSLHQRAKRVRYR